MTIYIDIDGDYKAHIFDDGTMLAYDTSHFNGKCQAYIEGFRIVPEGYTWIREDGVEFKGLMIAPWKDYALLAAAQEAYEQAQAGAMAAYEEGVNGVYEQ